MLPSELSLGPFKVDHAGMLSPATPLSFPRFAVRWRNRLLHTGMRQCSAEDATHGALELSVHIGRVPSSASSDAQRRQTSLAMAQLVPQVMPPGWRVRLMPDHSILLEATLAIGLPVSAEGLVVELTSFLLRLNPYLDELDASGLSQPSTLH